MTAGSQFDVGDVVVHLRRPEWGHGTISRVQHASHAGQPTQRLVVDFVNHGRVTLLSALAPVAFKEKEDTGSMSTSMSPKTSSGQGWLASLEEKSPTHRLTALPDALTDPFSSNYRRLQATLATFKYSTQPRALIDWAITQTGLSDPLTQFTRHELEQAFPFYAHARMAHLNELVRTMKREGDLGSLNKAMSETTGPAAEALAKALRA
jgi:hypothetical protein